MKLTSGSAKAPAPATLAIFVAAYFLSVPLGEHVYGSLAVPSPFWLPDSILLCALLLAPKTVQFVCRDLPAELDRDMSLCLFRIVQESLHNVVKHSGVRPRSSCRGSATAWPSASRMREWDSPPPLRAGHPVSAWSACASGSVRSAVI